MKKNINTGMIMDAVNLTKDAPEKNEAMQAAMTCPATADVPSQWLFL